MGDRLGLRLHGHDLFDWTKLRAIDRGRIDVVPKHVAGLDVGRTMVVVDGCKRQLCGGSHCCRQSDAEYGKGNRWNKGAEAHWIESLFEKETGNNAAGSKRLQGRPAAPNAAVKLPSGALSTSAVAMGRIKAVERHSRNRQAPMKQQVPARGERERSCPTLHTKDLM